MKAGILFLLPLILLFSFAGQPEKKPKSHIVEIKDMKFQPAELIVNKGDTVIWINRDMVPHDVTQQAKAWASPQLKTGESWKKVITRTDDYFCSIHVVMKGKVIVRPVGSRQ